MAGGGERGARCALALLLTLAAVACLAHAVPSGASGPLGALGGPLGPSLPASYIEDGDEPAAASSGLDDYTDNELARYLSPAKRSCIRRGGNCDHRPNDCCYNSGCRCNLWGTNCRCQRLGLFQKWGKK